MRRALALGAALWVAGGCASAAPVADRGDVLRRILPSTVQLRAEREGGGRRAASGVAIASDAAQGRTWILTTRHFLEPARPQQISVSTRDQRTRVRAEVLAVSPDTDLAVITAHGIVVPPTQLKDTARLGDEVLVVGFPWGRRLMLTSGIVSQIDATEGESAVEGPPRMVDASVSYGASGGGVFDAATGMLLGIVEGHRTARLTLSTTPERAVDIPVPGETTVVPVAVIRRFLDFAGLGTALPH
jgi:S1-C subfamily serine protease